MEEGRSQNRERVRGGKEGKSQSRERVVSGEL